MLVRALPHTSTLQGCARSTNSQKRDTSFALNTTAALTSGFARGRPKANSATAFAPSTTAVPRSLQNIECGRPKAKRLKSFVPENHCGTTASLVRTLPLVRARFKAARGRPKVKSVTVFTPDDGGAACRRRQRGGGCGDRRGRWSDDGKGLSARARGECAGGDAAAVVATGNADGATTGESCLRRGEWYAASPPFSSRELPGGTRRRDGPHHMFVPAAS